MKLKGAFKALVPSTSVLQLGPQMPGSGPHPFRMNCPNNAQDDRHTSDGDAFGTRSIGSEKELLKGKRFP